ncbi:MAG: uroporphyrinogen decarboxylase [Gammaproteobacteria bacterium]|nr:uroporphyrinogen decarboxylase [Gammaproteobacteria bacterium]
MAAAETFPDLFLRALRREPVPRTPVWIMRQAGRYLPEYRATRAQAGDFLTLCRTPELACEVTLQPIRRYGFDAAIIFSDILTVPDAMGLGLKLDEGIGPRFDRPIRSAADVARLGVPDPNSDLRYVMDAVRVTRAALGGTTPLIGFAGSPWTLASYAIEGGGSRDFKLAKGMLYGDPATAHRLLDVLAEAVSVYLKAQIAAGAQAVMLFDTWGGVLSTAAYAEFSLRYMARIVDDLAGTVPVILFTKGGGAWLEMQAETGAAALGLDWTVSMGAARARVGDRVALQGNLDPAILLAPEAVIRAEVGRVLESFGPGTGHVFNLGHGITPDVDPTAVAVLVDAVRELSPLHHRTA